MPDKKKYKEFKTRKEAKRTADSLSIPCKPIKMGYGIPEPHTSWFIVTLDESLVLHEDGVFRI